MARKQEKSIISVPPKGAPEPGFSNSKPKKQQQQEAKELQQQEAETGYTENKTMKDKTIKKEKRDDAGLPDPVVVP